MEHLISFEGGMDIDLSKSVLPKNKYLRADNMRLVTQNGQSLYAIENVKGNSLSFSFPSILHEVYKIKVSDTGICTITIQQLSGAVTTSNINVTTSTTGLDLYNALSSLTGFNTTWFVSYNEDYITVYNINFSANPTVSSSALTVTTVVNQQTNLQPIGSGTIRDDIYIFTCQSTDNQISPSGTAGQIWKLIYDKVTLSTTLTLVYNNIINFSTYNGIPPTGIRGRYENSNIQRLYWTDNYNSIRQLNVADSNAMSVDTSVLDIKPTVNLDTPILKAIDNNKGGILKSGVWQLCYRLYNSTGSLTFYSDPSNLVAIISADENGPHKYYLGDGSGVTTTKSITWTINNIDSDFTRIEGIAIYRDGKDSLPLILKFLDEPTPSGSSMDISLYGNETTTVITLDELNTFNSTFDICKTIADKDNRLFAANTRITSSDITFDARAYSFQAASTGILDTMLTNGSNTTLYTASDLGIGGGVGLNETHDAINPNKDVYRYRYNSNKLGGDGPNISYEFGTISTVQDKLTMSVSTSYGTGGFYDPGKNYTSGNINLGVSSHNYDTFNCSFDGCKNPYEMFLLKGYHRGEVYRFAIQFYNKQGQPVFTKWIADIKIPDHYDTNSNPDTSKLDYPTDFRNSWLDANNVCYSQQLYIKFNVDITSIKDQITGYRIVRVERKEEDKEVLGQGLINDTVLQTLSTGQSIHIPSYNDGTRADPMINASSSYSQGNVKTFNCPDWLLTGSRSLQNGDKIKILARVKTPPTLGYADTYDVSGTGDPLRFAKLYDWQNIGTYSFDVKELAFVPMGGQYVPTSGTISSGYTFYNTSHLFTGPSDQDGVGGNTMLLLTAGGFPDNYLQFGKFLCNYVRTRTNQYGGKTYSARSNNIYIPASEFVPIDNNSSTSYTLKCFGGDTFVGVFDNQKLFNKYNSGAAHVTISFTTFTSIECNVNPELRHISDKQFTVNSAGFPSTADQIRVQENFNYNTVYSAENNIRTYLPKPLNFTPNDEFDNRVYYSEIKINGELSDNWGNFKTNNYWDVEGSYGPINIIDTIDNQMLFYQDRAFGILMVNPIAQASTTIGEVILGKGSVIQKHNYVSQKIGCKHQWAQCKSEHGYYWLDIISKKIYRYQLGSQEQGFSDLGMYSYLQQNLVNDINVYDKPTWTNTNDVRNGAIAVYDKKNDEVVFTVFDSETGNNNPQTSSYTLVYTDHTSSIGKIQCYSSFWDQKPFIYITDDINIFSPNPLIPSTYKNIYIHNQGDYGRFYDTYYASKLKLLVNPFPKETKVFDNFTIHTETMDYSSSNPVNIFDETWEEIRAYNDYQNTDFQTLTINPTTGNLRRKERSWNLAVPRNRVLYTSTQSPDIFTDLGVKTFGERLRDKYLTVDLVYHNSVHNYNLVTHWFNTIFRKSDR